MAAGGKGRHAVSNFRIAVSIKTAVEVKQTCNNGTKLKREVVSKNKKPSKTKNLFKRAVCVEAFPPPPKKNLFMDTP